MNKRLLLVAGIALLAAGCGKNPAPAAVNNPVPEAATQASANTQGQGSFKDLLAMGKSIKCDSNFSSDGNTTNGTIYVANGQMRGDFNSQYQGKPMQMHMIVKDQTSYTWMEGSGMTMGFKAAVNPTSQTQATSTNGSVNVNQQVSYNCQPWSEDDSQFALPSGITFQDENQMMTPAQSQTKMPAEAMPAMPPAQNAAACAACNSAPASAKAQCLAALKCN